MPERKRFFFIEAFPYQDLTMDGRPLIKKREHEFVKNVIKYGKREVFKKMMKRFCFK